MNVVILSEPIGEAEFKDMEKLMNQYYPGLIEELQGFADSLNVKPSYLNFFDEAVFVNIKLSQSDHFKSEPLYDSQLP